MLHVSGILLTNGNYNLVEFYREKQDFGKKSCFYINIYAHILFLHWKSNPTRVCDEPNLCNKFKAYS